LERTRCSIAPTCRLLGVRQRDYALDPRVMADTLLGARDMLGFDGIYVSRDNWVMHESLGGEVTFPEDDESFSRTPLLGSLKEYRRLSVPDPRTAPGMKTVLAATAALAKGEPEAVFDQRIPDPRRRRRGTPSFPGNP
jgi:uroporphyrinogen-III decarboxylase